MFRRYDHVGHCPSSRHHHPLVCLLQPPYLSYVHSEIDVDAVTEFWFLIRDESRSTVRTQTNRLLELILTNMTFQAFRLIWPKIPIRHSTVFVWLKAKKSTKSSCPWRVCNKVDMVASFNSSSTHNTHQANETSQSRTSVPSFLRKPDQTNSTSSRTLQVVSQKLDRCVRCICPFEHHQKVTYTQPLDPPTNSPGIFINARYTLCLTSTDGPHRTSLARYFHPQYPSQASGTSIPLILAHFLLACHLHHLISVTTQHATRKMAMTTPANQWNADGVPSAFLCVFEVYCPLAGR